MGLFLVIVFISIIVSIAFLQQAKFGKLPSGTRLSVIQQSEHFKGGRFQNLSFTPTLSEGVSYYTAMRDYFFHKSKRSKPLDILPSVKTDLKQLDPTKDVLVWFGHSSYFIQIDGKKILVDPVFSGAASPIPPTTRSYAGSDIYTPADFPTIDYLIISHDHWDHLDYGTILGLKGKIKKVICGLGVAAHFERWGVEADNIIELDWFNKATLDAGFEITATPGRHFSGRGLQAARSLWVSYVFQTPTIKLFIGGDSGYDTHFASIGEKFGPFDLAILECGQYNKSWKNIHMMPEETVQAAIDLKAKKLLPVHWAKFTLSLHAWDDSITRVTAEAYKKEMPIIHPMIGQQVPLKEDNAVYSKWWETVG
jgi:L-ascorbate metabolism protein UlaG (beta-lactamase superfamily)